MAWCGALGDLLQTPLADPMATEIVSVPTRGMERWLAQTLSERFGVCANVDFPSPHRIVTGAIAAATGVDPDEDPWRPERSAWALLDVVNAHLDEPWLERLKRYLGEPDDDVRRARRLGIVRHLAELFDRYALHRPGHGPRMGDRGGRPLAGRAVAPPARAHRRGRSRRAPRALHGRHRTSTSRRGCRCSD